MSRNNIESNKAEHLLKRLFCHSISLGKSKTSDFPSKTGPTSAIVHTSCVASSTSNGQVHPCDTILSKDVFILRFFVDGWDIVEYTARFEYDGLKFQEVQTVQCPISRSGHIAPTFPPTEGCLWNRYNQQAGGHGDAILKKNHRKNDKRSTFISFSS